MPTDFVVALSHEIAMLERELAGDPRWAKLTDLKRLRDQFYGSTPKPTTVDQPMSRLTSTAPTQGRRPSPERERMLGEAEKLIASNHGEPVPTAAIVGVFGQIGLEVPGVRPINYVSAILSSSTRFKANGRQGWTMASPSEVAEAILDEAPTLVERPSGVKRSMISDGSGQLLNTGMDDHDDDAPSADDLRDAELDRLADEHEAG